MNTSEKSNRNSGESTKVGKKKGKNRKINQQIEQQQQQQKQQQTKSSKLNQITINGNNESLSALNDSIARNLQIENGATENLEISNGQSSSSSSTTSSPSSSSSSSTSTIAATTNENPNNTSSTKKCNSSSSNKKLKRKSLNAEDEEEDEELENSNDDMDFKSIINSEQQIQCSADSINDHLNEISINSNDTTITPTTVPNISNKKVDDLKACSTSTICSNSKFSDSSQPNCQQSNDETNNFMLMDHINIPKEIQDRTVDAQQLSALTTSTVNGLDLSNVVIEYKEYESELQMQDIMRLIQAELSEPYSIYTYRYFIYNWPKLCFLAAHGNEYVGAIVCKLDMHMHVIKRGYIAMLAVKKEYRKLKIGTNLVQKAIEAMLADDADEVVLETEMKNLPALRLYENLGFVRDKRLFRYYLNGVDALRLKLWFR